MQGDANVVAKSGWWAEVLSLSPVFFPLYYAAESFDYFNWNVSLHLCFSQLSLLRRPQVILVALAHTSVIFRWVISSVDTGTWEWILNRTLKNLSEQKKDKNLSEQYILIVIEGSNFFNSVRFNV